MVNLLKRIVRKLISFFGLQHTILRIRYLFANEVCNISAKEAEKELQAVAIPHGTTALTRNVIDESEYNLSIIVPAYNAEKWIDDCLNSILSQKTKYRYKLIVIDDGSTDSTALLIDARLSNTNLQVIRQENRGHSGARNVALKHLHSDYVMFVDSDDILLPNAIEALLDKAYEKNADIVEGNGYKFNENGYLGKVKIDKAKDSQPVLWGTPWLKVIRSELFERIEFPEGYLYEDTIISFLLFPLAKRIFTIPDDVYAYRIHSASITQTHTNNVNRLDSYYIMLLVHQNMNDLEIPLNYESYKKTMHHIVFTYRRCILLPEEIKRDVFVATYAFLEKNYSEFWLNRDEYYLLAKAIRNHNYAKYRIFCEMF